MRSDSDTEAGRPRKYFDVGQYYDLDESAPLLERTNKSQRNYLMPLNTIMIIAVIIIGLTSIVYLPKIYTSSIEMAETSAKKSLGKPNFIFVLADDLGWNSMGYSNFDLDFATPRMTAMAKEGIIMKNYYSQEVCTPARAALMTGRFPSSIGMQFGEVQPTENLGLLLGETILPEVLRDEGYKNYAIGKWNLGHYNPEYLPTARGFDEFLGYMDGHNYYWSKRSPDMSNYYDIMYANSSCYNLYDGDDRYNYSTILYKNKALDVIYNHDFEEAPMFLYLPFQAAHDPFSDYENSYPDGLTADYVGESRYEDVTTNVVGGKRQQYAMSLMMLDDSVNEIMSAMDEAGQKDNTYFIFASDNGGCYSAGGRNGPLRGSKGSLFEGGTKVDAFVWSSLLGEAKGTTYEGLMHVSDWFATILGWADAKFEAEKGYELDSRDHSNIMTMARSRKLAVAPARDYLLYNLYWDVEGQNFTMLGHNAPFAIRDTQYKLIHTYVGNKQDRWYPTNSTVRSDDDFTTESSCSQDDALTGHFTKMLFDLINDPYEETNLYDEDGYDDIKNRLMGAVCLSCVKPETWYMSTSTATKVWMHNDYFIQPWNFTKSNQRSSRAQATGITPSRCTSYGVLSPSY